MDSKFRHNTIWLLVITLICCFLVQLSAQQFYPNGRYGRRDSMPPLTDSTREMAITFFGDGSVNCVYTGFAEFYRCTRKFSGTSSETMD